MSKSTRFSVSVDSVEHGPGPTLDEIGQALEPVNKKLALLYYTAAAKLAPNALTMYRAGVLLMNDKKYFDAASWFRRAAKLTPDHVITIYDLAKCELLGGRHEEALRAARKALRLQPNHAGATLVAARAAASVNKWRDVIKISKSYDQFDGLGELIALRALAFHALGDEHRSAEHTARLSSKWKRRYSDLKTSLKVP